MGFKMKGFPMHNSASALKQVTEIVEEPVITEEPVVEKGEWVPVPAGEKRGIGDYERNTVTGEVRSVNTSKELTREELEQKVLMEQEISALGEEPDPFMEPEANEAYWVKHRAITSKYGQ